MITVKATREGLLGGRTATGDRVTRSRPFVALPSVRALERFVRLVNPRTGHTAIAYVDDVGPWNEHDDAYVFQTATEPRAGTPEFPPIRPQAERGTDTRGRATNGAGIDLSETIWARLGMVDNGPIAWEFLE